MKKKQPIGLLKETFYASKNAYLSAVFFSLFINILTLTIPLYMMQVYDRVLSSHGFETLIYLSVIALLALITLSFFDAIRSYILLGISTWFDKKITPLALALSPDQLLQGNAYPEQVLRDLGTIRQFLGGGAIFTFFDAPWVFIYLLVIFFLNPLLGICSTIGAIILLACALANEIATKKTLEKANEVAISNTLETTASFRNAEVIQAMGMTNALINQWYNNNEKFIFYQKKSNQMGINILSISKFFRFSLQILILAAGAYLVITHQITGGMMIAASILMSRALAPVEQSIVAWKQYQQMKLAKKRLDDHLMFKSGRTATYELPAPAGHVLIEKVYYSVPPSQKLIINNINQQIKAGEMIAIIGASSAGKSTLARLILGILKPSAGTIRLDNADVYQWAREDFGQYIGYLPQDIELFNGSVKSNIARMGEVNDAAVIKAAQMAECHDMILHLAQGYDTLIHRDGFQLSGGQRQRIALARALYGDPKLCVFDEPNSNLDSEGEIALLRTLDKLKKKGTTVFIIAHRPLILRFVDKIMVLSEGKVQFSGPRDEIMAKLAALSNAQKTQSPGEHNG